MTTTPGSRASTSEPRSATRSARYQPPSWRSWYSSSSTGSRSPRQDACWDGLPTRRSRCSIGRERACAAHTRGSRAMTDARTDLQLDALLRRLDVPAEPAAGFVSESLDGLLPIAQRARARDRSFVGRLLRNVQAQPRTPRGATPRLALVMTLVILALLAALVVAYIGSQRRLPQPFGLAANGTIAYVNENHVFLASADGADPRQITFEGGRQVDPTFSRDGTRLAWRAYPPGIAGRVAEPADLVVADADGSHAIVVASQ